MNIIVLGNGFDRAHGLPTQYTDFLKFIDFFRERAYEKCSDYILANYLKKLFSEYTDKVEYLDSLVHNNIWLEYFDLNINYSDEDTKKEIGWIDFESEIAEVIHLLEAAKKEYIESVKINKQYINETKAHKVLRDIFSCCPSLETVPTERKFRFGKKIFSPKEYSLRYETLNRFGKFLYDSFYIKVYTEKVFESWNARLIKDLNRLIKALEFYLVDYVQNINTTKCSTDICRIIKEAEDRKVKTCVLSFNYTNTFKNTYAKLFEKSEPEIHYIHGEAKGIYQKDTNNMVLGIDEYLSNDERSINTSFIGFQKFYQRIQKRTGATYEDWLRKLNDSPDRSNVYIFGHSLDKTDKDILLKFLLNPKIKTVIFYHNQKAYEDKVINLIKLIDKDRLIEKVYSGNPLVVFEKQKELVDCKCKEESSCYGLHKKCINFQNKPDCSLKKETDLSTDELQNTPKFI